MVYLIAFSLAAIGMLAVLMHRMGYSASVTVQSEEAALRIYASEFPADRVQSVDLLADSAGALLVLASGQLGVIWAVGSKWLVRRIESGDLRAVEASQNTVTIKFYSFSSPSMRLVLETEVQAQHWCELFVGRL